MLSQERIGCGDGPLGTSLIESQVPDGDATCFLLQPVVMSWCWRLRNIKTTIPRHAHLYSRGHQALIEPKGVRKCMLSELTRGASSGQLLQGYARRVVVCKLAVASHQPAGRPMTRELKKSGDAGSRYEIRDPPSVFAAPAGTSRSLTCARSPIYPILGAMSHLLPSDF